jgi:5'-nucleotidase
MNPGGIRTVMAYKGTSDTDPDGNLTYREAASVQPFANTLVTLSLTGAQLKSVLEEQWQPAGSARPFLKLGVSKGLTYTYDPAAVQGSHITSMTLNGEAIDPAASYLVAANSFLAAGGDNFATFAQGTDKKDTGKVDLQSMVDWFTANKTATPDLGQRAVGAAVTPAAPADGYQAGDQVTVNLSSLAFSAGEQTPTEVAFALGDIALGTAGVTVAVTDAYDEAGSASYTFTVPADAAGKALTATPNVGQAVVLPVSFAETTQPGEFAGAITLDSSKVAAGGTLTITGSEYQPGETVTVQLQPKKGEAVSLGTVKVGGDGSFSASVTVPAATHPGVYTVSVAQADGDAATAVVHVNRKGGVGHIVQSIVDWVLGVISGWF